MTKTAARHWKWGLLAIPLMAVVAIATLGPAMVRGQTVADDFNDGVLNTTIWTQAGGNQAFVESGGELRFTSTPNRDVLVTNATFDPTSSPVTITGRVRIGGNNNTGFFFVFTRVSSVAGGGNGFPDAGVFVQLNSVDFGGVITLGKIESPGGAFVFFAQSPAGSTPANFGDVYDFAVTDDGTTLSATFTEVVGAEAGASATISTSGFTFNPTVTADLVGFSHREGRQYFLDFVSIDAGITVDIDIKPGSDPNSINVGKFGFVKGGVVPVAILTTPSFDAADVDPFTVRLDAATVRLKGKSGNAGSLEDVDGDGDLDLVVHVKDWFLVEGATTATLTGALFDGTSISGTDTVRVVP